MGNSRQLRPLLEYAAPENEKILVRKQDKETEAMSVWRYNQFFDTHMAHGIFYDANRRRIIKKMRTQLYKQHRYNIAYQEKNAELDNYLDNPLNYFYLSYINPTCGYGLVANQHIKPDTVVGIYSGLLITRGSGDSYMPLDQRAYDMRAYYDDPMKIYGSQYFLTVRAQEYGDLTRFAPHMYYQDNLENLSARGELDSSVPLKNICTANLTCTDTVYRGTPVIYFKTNRFIYKNNLCSISYGTKYWHHREQPYLFVKDDQRNIKTATYDVRVKKYILNPEEVITLRTPEILQKRKNFSGAIYAAFFPGRNQPQKEYAQEAEKKQQFQATS